MMRRRNSILLFFISINLMSCSSTSLETSSSNFNKFEQDHYTVDTQEQTLKIGKIFQASKFADTDDKLKSSLLKENLYYQESSSIPEIIKEIKKGFPVAIRLKEENEKESLFLIKAYSSNKEIFHLTGEGKDLELKREELLSKILESQTTGLAFLYPAEFERDNDLDALFFQALDQEIYAPITARSTFQKLIELNPSNANYAIALANNYFPREPDKALEYINLAIAKEPNSFEAWYNLAAYQSAMGKKREARRTSRKVLSMFRRQNINSSEIGQLRLMTTL